MTAAKDIDTRVGDDCREFAAFLATGGAEGLAIRYDTFLIVDEIIRQQVYDFESWLPPGATVVNFGAHVGILPLYVLFKSRPRKIIVAEPDPCNLELLLHNTRPWRHNIDVLAAAIARPEAPRLVRFRPDASNTGAGTIATVGLPVLSIPVAAMVDLARQASGGQPVYVFCDCEGGEWSVFAEGTDLTDVAVICGEVHFPDGMKPEWGPGPHTRAEFVRLMTNRGFTLDIKDLPRDERTSLPGGRLIFTAVNQRLAVPDRVRHHDEVTVVELTGRTDRLTTADPTRDQFASVLQEPPVTHPYVYGDPIALVQSRYADIASAFAITREQEEAACGPVLTPWLTDFLNPGGGREVSQSRGHAIATRLYKLVNLVRDGMRSELGGAQLSRGSLLLDSPWTIDPDVVRHLTMSECTRASLRYRSRAFCIALSERIRALELMNRTGVADVLLDTDHDPRMLANIGAERWPDELSVVDAVTLSDEAVEVIRIRFPTVAEALAITESAVSESMDRVPLDDLTTFLHPTATTPLDQSRVRAIAIQLLALVRRVQGEFAEAFRAAGIAEGRELFENPWAVPTSLLRDVGVAAATAFDRHLGEATDRLRGLGYSDMKGIGDRTETMDDLFYHIYGQPPIPGYPERHYKHAMQTIRLDGVRAIDMTSRLYSSIREQFERQLDTETVPPLFSHELARPPATSQTS